MAAPGSPAFPSHPGRCGRRSLGAPSLLCCLSFQNCIPLLGCWASLKAALILFNLFSVIFLLFVLYYFWKILSNSSSSRFIGLSICAGVFLDEPALHVESAFGWLQPFFGCGVSKDLNASFCVCSSVLLSLLGPGSPRPGGLFGAETNELILRFMWKCNRSRVTKTLLNSSTKLEASHETDCDATSQNGMALASGETGSGGPTWATHAHARLHTCTPAHSRRAHSRPRTLTPCMHTPTHSRPCTLTPYMHTPTHSHPRTLTPCMHTPMHSCPCTCTWTADDGMEGSAGEGRLLQPALLEQLDTACQKEKDENFTLYPAPYIKTI